MKVGIITHYDVHNHGALLQLNALVKILNRMGIDAKALQFEKNYDFMGPEWKNKYEISWKSIPIYINYLFRNGLGRTIYNIRKKRTLSSFKRQEHLLGAYYSAAENMDAVIIGSDEVFALHTGPTPVFFGYACPSDNVFSYAASFGPTTHEEILRWHCEAFVSGGLRAMSGISVRDENSRTLVERLTGIEAFKACDPVILYGYERELMDLSNVKLPPYVLIYAYDDNMNEKSEVDAIRQFANEHHLKIVSPGFYHAWADYNINVSPIELLSYFRDAQYVITDTFHGSVISIITHKNFAVKIRTNSNKLLNLLDEYHLSERVIRSLDNLNDILMRPIDENAICAELEKRRADSMAFLSTMIAKCK